MSPREIAGEVQECAACGWRHRPSQACPKSKPPQGAAKTDTVPTDPLAKFKDWEARAQAQPTSREDSGRQCPGCQAPIVVVRNFLGVVWEEVGAELWDEHQRECRPAPVQVLPTLQAPRRPGLPYKDGPDE